MLLEFRRFLFRSLLEYTRPSTIVTLFCEGRDDARRARRGSVRLHRRRTDGPCRTGVATLRYRTVEFGRDPRKVGGMGGPQRRDGAPDGVLGGRELVPR